MDRIAMVWLLVGVFAGAMIFQTELSEALYSIPPTPAWTQIEIIEDPIIVNTTITSITANSSSDKRYYGSDGSINITITEFTP